MGPLDTWSLYCVCVCICVCVSVCVCVCLCLCLCVSVYSEYNLDSPYLKGCLIASWGNKK
jgi:hypothetical protein